MHDDHELEALAQRAAEERLAACNEELFRSEEGLPQPEEPRPDSGAAAPYCGCDTCIVREVLDAAWPHMLELARREVAGVA